MIPKIFHYCWFSGDVKPREIIDYINSWRLHCPDYEIIEWNSDNFDVTCNCFTQEAFISKKWAFVTDYARLKILYEHGGIYLDSDVELTKNLDSLLHDKSFIGFETKQSFGPHIIGAEKGSSWIKFVLSKYDSMHFVNQDGSYNQTVMPLLITKILSDFYPELRLDNTRQSLSENLILYPNDYFSPKNCGSRVITITENTHAIHHFSASWVPQRVIRVNKQMEYLVVKNSFPLNIFIKSKIIMAFLRIFTQLKYALEDHEVREELHGILQTYCHGVKRYFIKK